MQVAQKGVCKWRGMFGSRIRYRLVGPETRRAPVPRKTIGRMEDAKIEAGKTREAEVRFELRQRREVTLTSISVRLRRCLRYIRKRLARAFTSLGIKVILARRKGSRYVSYRTLLHLRKCTNQTNDAGQCTVVIPSRRLESNRNDRFYRLSVTCDSLERTFSSLSLSLCYSALRFVT